MCERTLKTIPLQNTETTDGCVPCLYWQISKGNTDATILCGAQTHRHKFNKRKNCVVSSSCCEHGLQVNTLI